MIDFICAKVTDDGTRPDWAGPAIGLGTVNAFVRRLRSSQRPLGPLLRGDLSAAAGHRGGPAQPAGTGPDDSAGARSEQGSLVR
jgi:hypothetical protein